MRIIVAGAAGFIGYHLAGRLAREGNEVIGIDSMTTGSEANVRDLSALPSFTFVRADIRQPVTVAGPIDRIFNMACPASPVDFRDKGLEIMETCSTGVRNLLELARDKHALFLQASTSECYGDPLEHPQRETYYGNVNPIGPRAVYDEGKRFAEAMIFGYHRAYNLHTRIVRIFNTYGPQMRADDGRALPNFINQALRGQPVTVHGDGSQTRSFCYVDDLVEAILRTSNSDYIDPINIGNDSEITVRQAAEAVIEMTGGRSKIVFTDRPVNDPERRRPDLTRAREVLGWSPTVPWRVGLQRTVDYFKSIA